MGGWQRDMDHLLVTNHEPLRAQSRGIRGQGRKGGGKIMERSGLGGRGAENKDNKGAGNHERHRERGAQKEA